MKHLPARGPHCLSISANLHFLVQQDEGAGFTPASHSSGALRTPFPHSLGTVCVLEIVLVPEIVAELLTLMDTVADWELVPVKEAVWVPEPVCEIVLDAVFVLVTLLDDDRELETEIETVDRELDWLMLTVLSA